MLMLHKKEKLEQIMKGIDAKTLNKDLYEYALDKINIGLDDKFTRIIVTENSLTLNNLKEKYLQSQGKYVKKLSK